MAWTSRAVVFDAMHHEITTTAEPPEFVLAWIAQLLDPQFLELMRHIPYDRLDVQLAASRGRVSREPVIVLNGGSTAWKS